MKLLTTWDELEELIMQGRVEGPSLDFKREIPPNEKIAKIICAFANAAGGLIIFGAKYDDSVTRKLNSFPGVPLTLNFDSRMEQIAMNLRPRVAVEASKPITIPGQKDRVVYVLLVHSGQLQPHQMEDGRFMARYGSQSGHLPENIVEQMYLARSNHGNEAEAFIQEANYGLPQSIQLFKAESYWVALSLMPIHFRKDLLINSSKLRDLLQEMLPVDIRGTHSWRETHFGYRLIFPRQEVGQRLPKDYDKLIEVHNNGLILFSDLTESQGLGEEAKNLVSGNHFLSTCSKVFQQAVNIYSYAQYGGFLKVFISLKSVHNKYLFFHKGRSREKSPYPYESEDGRLQISADCSVVDLNSAEHLEMIRLKLRQSFGFITP